MDVAKLPAPLFFLALIGLIVFGLWARGLEWVSGDEDEIVEYRLSRTEDYLPSGECSGNIVAVPPIHYRTHPARGEVVALKDSGKEIEVYTNCTIFDRKNWSCEDQSDRSAFSAIDGKIVRRGVEGDQAEVGAMPRLSFRLVDATATAQDVAEGRVSPGSMVLPADPDTHGPGDPQQYAVRRTALVTGDKLADAQQQFRQGQWAVSFSFNNAGSRRFAEVTQENVGKPFAIVLDGKAVSAPVIRSPILGGTGEITGGFSAEEATQLASLLRDAGLEDVHRQYEQRAKQAPRWRYQLQKMKEWFR